MSDLLRKKPNQKLLNRANQIKPAETFSIDTKDSKPAAPSPILQDQESKKKTTTVRVSDANQNKLNALVTLGVGESVDEVIDVLIGEFDNHHLSKEQKKIFSLLLETAQRRKKK